MKTIKGQDGCDYVLLSDLIAAMERCNRLRAKNCELLAEVKKLKAQRNEARARLEAAENQRPLKRIMRALGYEKKLSRPVVQRLQV